MNFVIDNWMLFAVALVSASLLLWPMVSGAAGASALTPAGAVQLINREKAVVVDVSEEAEFATGHVVGAKNVPFGQLDAKLSNVVKNKGVPLLLVCPTGARANRAVAAAKKLGYEKAQAVAGGMKGWRDAGLPVEKA
ncbi:rhodanese-like domain-containing protein [Pseudorhodoferax sp. Leaf265]|jgi:rhodanese-related sulfurtransferase|uniref:rhodanese-like domain-containing protein n=1 Tax=Pseudorhodoferax sp. Leaf265 TaxID=1736315 RepID=UPI0006F36292|nr:rhodanese-like domain-containing protein [Pseudorhodoferax sp. Leaf265]KQP05031.1 sulfurtransferase [Pseudorhodoferax sp. Leaf265]